MNRTLKLNKLHFIALFLTLFMISFFGFSCFSYKKVSADGYDDYYGTSEYTLDEIANLYSNGDLSEDAIEAGCGELTAGLQEYLFLDTDGYLHFDYDGSPDYNIEAVFCVERNVNAMNELVDLGLGYIEDVSFEFILDPGHSLCGLDNQTRAVSNFFEIYNFKLRWNKATISGNSQFAVVMGMVFLIADIGLVAQTTPLKRILLNLTEPATVQEILAEVVKELKKDLSHTALEFAVMNIFDEEINPNTIEMIAAIIGMAANYIHTGTAFTSAFKVIAGLFLPSMLDCLISMYLALFFDSGLNMIACWFPTRRDDVWGIALKPICY